jgi:hypothetical protein
VEVKPTPWFAIAGLAAWIVFSVTMSVVFYEKTARGLQKEIDALDSMTTKT